MLHRPLPMLLRVRPSCSQLNSPVARDVRAGLKRTLAGQRPLLPHLNLLGFESHWRHTKPGGKVTCADEILKRTCHFALQMSAFDPKHQDIRGGALDLLENKKLASVSVVAS